jgi:hypothetical protein
MTSDLRETFLQMGCLPHQADFAASVFSPDSNRRQFLLSPPGLGKSYAIGSVIGHALRTNHASRVLVIVPSTALAEQWREIAQRAAEGSKVFRVDRRIIREFEAGAARKRVVLPSHAVFVINAQLARQADVASILSESRWDIIVVDEAHHLSQSKVGVELLENLVRRSPKSRIIFLGDSRITLEAVLAIGGPASVTQWTHGNLVDNEGDPLFPKPEIRFVEFARSADETNLLRQLQDFVSSLGEADPVKRQIGIGLLRGAASSLYALEQGLRQIRQTRNELVHGVHGSNSYLDPDEENSTVEQRVIDSIDLEKKTASILEKLDDVETDSKFIALLNVLDELKAGESSHVCILTEFSRTATYLAASLQDHYPNLYVLRGDLSFETRESSIKEFGRTGGILIETGAVAVPTSDVRDVILYDVPLSSSQLDERLGLFLRVRRKQPVTMYFLVDDLKSLSIESLYVELLLKKKSISNDDILLALRG